MSAVSSDWSTEISVTEVIEPAVLAADATQAAGMDMAGVQRATVLVDVGTITGGGSIIVSLTSSDTLGGSYTAETSADVFVTLPVVLAAAGAYTHDIKIESLTKRFVKVVLTEAGTYSAATSAVVLAQLERVN